MKPQHSFGDGQSAPDVASVSGTRSIAQILQEIVNRVGGIIRSEFQLAATEVKQDVAERARAAALIVIGGALLALASGFLLLAAFFALAISLPAWLAALVVGAVTALVGGILVYVGQARIRQSPNLQMTTQSAEDNIRWLKNRSK